MIIADFKKKIGCQTEFTVRKDFEVEISKVIMPNKPRLCSKVPDESVTADSYNAPVMNP